MKSQTLSWTEIILLLLTTLSRETQKQLFWINKRKRKMGWNKNSVLIHFLKGISNLIEIGWRLSSKTLSCSTSSSQEFLNVFQTSARFWIWPFKRTERSFKLIEEKPKTSTWIRLAQTTNTWLTSNSKWSKNQSTKSINLLKMKIAKLMRLKWNCLTW